MFAVAGYSLKLTIGDDLILNRYDGLIPNPVLKVILVVIGVGRLVDIVRLGEDVIFFDEIVSVRWVVVHFV